MTAHVHTLFSFAGITASLIFTDFDAVEGKLEARGFDAGGDMPNANVRYYDATFSNPAERDMAIANGMNFVSTEMLKQAAWQAA